MVIHESAIQAISMPNVRPTIQQVVSICERTEKQKKTNLHSWSRTKRYVYPLKHYKKASHSRTGRFVGLIRSGMHIRRRLLWGLEGFDISQCQVETVRVITYQL